MSIDETKLEFMCDIEDVTNWQTNIYDTLFGEVFSQLDEMYRRLKCKEVPISDSELEWALTTFPLGLISASESLNKLRTELEVIKFKNTRRRVEYMKAYAADATTAKLSSSAKAEYISAQMTEYILLQTAYSLLITRIENKIALSKEFIMGAKKVWDSRRVSERVMPVNPDNVEADLPEYILGG